MGSDHCAGIVRKTLQRLDDLDNIESNIDTHHVKVTKKSNGPSGESLKQAVEKDDCLAGSRGC